jgi:hypothetical protein
LAAIRERATTWRGAANAASASAAIDCGGPIGARSVISVQLLQIPQWQVMTRPALDPTRYPSMLNRGHPAQEEFFMAVIESIKEKADFLKAKAGSLYLSAHELNKLTIDKFEEASKIGLGSATYFSGLGIKQLRAASSIKDME